MRVFVELDPWSSIGPEIRMEMDFADARSSKLTLGLIKLSKHSTPKKVIHIPALRIPER
jgi:hypothetical protein